MYMYIAIARHGVIRRIPESDEIGAGRAHM